MFHLYLKTVIRLTARIRQYRGVRSESGCGSSRVRINLEGINGVFPRSITRTGRRKPSVPISDHVAQKRRTCCELVRKRAGLSLLKERNIIRIRETTRHVCRPSSRSSAAERCIENRQRDQSGNPSVIRESGTAIQREISLSIFE